MLFYSPEYREKKVAEPKSQLTGRLSMVSPQSSGWLDRTFARPPEPITVSFSVPNFLPGALLAGDAARVRVALPGTTAAAAGGATAQPVK